MQIFLRENFFLQLDCSNRSAMLNLLEFTEDYSRYRETYTVIANFLNRQR